MFKPIALDTYAVDCGELHSSDCNYTLRSTIYDAMLRCTLAGSCAKPLSDAVGSSVKLRHATESADPIDEKCIVKLVAIYVIAWAARPLDAAGNWRDDFAPSGREEGSPPLREPKPNRQDFTTI
jgi:hypothetical protein